MDESREYTLKACRQFLVSKYQEELVKKTAPHMVEQFERNLLKRIDEALINAHIDSIDIQIDKLKKERSVLVGTRSLFIIREEPEIIQRSGEDVKPYQSNGEENKENQTSKLAR